MRYVLLFKSYVVSFAGGSPWIGISKALHNSLLLLQLLIHDLAWLSKIRLSLTESSECYDFSYNL